MRDYLINNIYIYISESKFYSLDNRHFYPNIYRSDRKYYLTLNQRLFFYAALNL